MTGVIVAVSVSQKHAFSKANVNSIQLLAGLGVEGDAHLGKTVKHRSRVKKDPTQPNLRQVHLIQSELLVELLKTGFTLNPGDMGENITTQGVDLLNLPQGAKLHLGDTAVVEITGLRNPCNQINKFQKGLMASVLDKDDYGKVIRKTGVMGIVLRGGRLQPGDLVRVEKHAGVQKPLEVV